MMMLRRANLGNPGSEFSWGGLRGGGNLGLTPLAKPLHYNGQAGDHLIGGVEMVSSKIQNILIWLALTIVLMVAVKMFLPIGLCGFDWLHFFEDARNIPDFYPPWTCYVCEFLTWPLLTAITLSTYAMAVMKRAQSVASAIAAFVVFPLWWTLYLGQLDGLALLGVLGLPWLAPLALMKPQVAGFAVLARRKNLIVAASFLLASLALWGSWPAKLLTYPIERANPLRWPQQIGLGLWGLPLALVVLWVVPGWNIDKLMLAGTFITPALIPYQLLPLMPAIARLPGWLAWIMALSSWLPLTAHWLGGPGWWLAWISVLLLGAGLTGRSNGGRTAV